MQVIGITGGVGAGKTAILEYLEKNYKVKNLIADRIAHDLMKPGTECYEKLLRILPAEVYEEDNENIDRKALAKVLFSSAKLREKVNAIVHPAVKQFIREEIAEQRKMEALDYLVIEAALLIEDHYDEICDELWYIYTSREERKKRLMENRGYSEKKVEQIFASQLSEEVYRQKCRIVIDNNGTREETFYQIAQVMKSKGETKQMEQQLNGVPLVFGLDIGTRNVVGTVGYKEENEFIVAAQFMKQHETRSMLDGQIHDIRRVGRTIHAVKRQLEEQLKIKLEETCIAAAGRVLKTVNTTVEYEYPEENVVTGEDIHTLDLLGVEKAQKILNENNDTRFKFYCVGYSVVKYYLNGDIISNLEGHKADVISEDIIATFLPEDVVDGLYSAVEFAGMKVANLTLEPIAAINVAIPEAFRMLNIALVDVGAGTSDISITRDGSIIAYGMIPSAGDEITEAIVQHYLVDFKTAEHIKLASTTEETIEYQDIMMISHTIPATEVWELMEPLVEKLTKDIADKIKELNGDKSVSATFIVGGGGKVHGFVENLAEELELPKERVALRGEEVLQEIHFEQPEIRKDPLLVTPIGICLNYYDQKNNFIFVRFNGERVKLYDNSRLTVVDAALAAGFPKEQLFPRRGKEINFTVNGRKRIARGDAGEAAVINVNGRPGNINTPLEPNMEITIEPSTAGSAATYQLGQLEEYGTATLTFLVNGRMVSCPKFAEVNGSLEPPYYEIQEGDDIEMRGFYTVGQVMEFMDVEVDMDREILVNNKTADLGTLVYENFSIDWTILSYRTAREDMEELAEQAEPAENTEGTVTAEQETTGNIGTAGQEMTGNAGTAAREMDGRIGTAARETDGRVGTEARERTENTETADRERIGGAGTEAREITGSVVTEARETTGNTVTGTDARTAEGEMTAHSRAERETTIEDIRPTIQREPEVQQAKTQEPAQTALNITVNNMPILMTGKPSYIFVDVFDQIDFDLNEGNGRAIVTKLNGQVPSYTAPLSDGDVIEIYWEN